MEAKFDTPRGPYYFFGCPSRDQLFKNTMFMDEAFRNQFAQNQLPRPKWIAEVSTGALGDEVDQMCGLPFDQSPVLGRREDVKVNTFWDTEDDRPFTWEAQKGRLELMRRASDLQMRYSDLKLEMGTMTRHEWELKAELHEHNQMWDLGARSVVQRKLESLSLSEELGTRDGQEELPSEFISSEEFGPPSTVFSGPSLDSDE
jgi:hypothetical protein